VRFNDLCRLGLESLKNLLQVVPKAGIADLARHPVREEPGLPGCINCAWRDQDYHLLGRTIADLDAAVHCGGHIVAWILLEDLEDCGIDDIPQIVNCFDWEQSRGGARQRCKAIRGSQEHAVVSGQLQAKTRLCCCNSFLRCRSAPQPMAFSLSVAIQIRLYCKSLSTCRLEQALLRPLAIHQSPPSTPARLDRGLQVAKIILGCRC
jgi:hypothetical protein